MEHPKEKTLIKLVVGIEDSASASALLATASGLSRSRIKDAMKKGAVRISPRRGRQRRLRRASYICKHGEILELFYDPGLLARIPPSATCLADYSKYSVWDKPPGILSQGTNYGDHCALTRQAELYFKPLRKVYLIHRLDREASGLMVLAHDSKTAAFLSKAFREGRVEKKYQVVVAGLFLQEKESGVIDQPLDGKHARTEYMVVAHNKETEKTLVDVRILTGRLHQVRRHFLHAGFPVLGDPRYGRGNKHPAGLHLRAVSLAFICPVKGREVSFTRPGFDPEDI